jgi:hypothetical protein
MARDKKAVKE